MHVAQPISKSMIEPYIGHAVCVVLQDGSYYCGKISGVKRGKLILSGSRGNGSLPDNPELAKAQISQLGFSGLLGSLTGAGAARSAEGAQGAAGTGSGFGFLGKAFRICLGIVKFVFPLLGKFGFSI